MLYKTPEGSKVEREFEVEKIEKSFFFSNFHHNQTFFLKAFEVKHFSFVYQKLLFFSCYNFIVINSENFSSWGII